jgi:hypothetical protein
MASKNQQPAEGDSVVPATATPHPPPQAEPTEAELAALMEAASPDGHKVPPKNRLIETTQQAGEYVIGHPKHSKGKE